MLNFSRWSQRSAQGAALAALLVTIGALGSSCASNGPADLSSGCAINTDCNKPLVCAFQLCHQQCKTTRDCPAGERCIASDRPYNVCQLPGESTCSYNSQCPSGETCASDQQCRDQCKTARDCVANQVCVAGGVCADPSELTDAGSLPAAKADAGHPAPGPGLSCLHNSDCGDGGLVCIQGACQDQCFADIDCVPPEGPGGVCVAHRCVSCRYNSDCGNAGLVCRRGLCGVACVTTIDCALPQGPGGECVENQCTVLPHDAGTSSSSTSSSSTSSSSTSSSSTSSSSTSSSSTSSSGSSSSSSSSSTSGTVSVDAGAGYTVPKGAGVVIDNSTQLCWEQYSAPTVVDGGSVVYGVKESAAYCSSLSLNGLNNWRMPTVEELASILSVSNDATLFPDTQFGGYYGTSSVLDPQHLWCIAFYQNGGGASTALPISSIFSVRCVASTATTTGSGYDTTSIAGVVIDSSTGLWWQQPIDQANRSGNDCSTGCTLAEAESYCTDLRIAGESDWRVPTFEELETLESASFHDPAIDPVAFGGTPSAKFWTTSLVPGNANLSWYVNFVGTGGSWTDNTSVLNRVRCVR